MELPAGIVAWLEEGIDVCDVGPGIEHVEELAQKFPRSRFVHHIGGELAQIFDLVIWRNVLDVVQLGAIRRALRPGAVHLCNRTLPVDVARASGLDVRPVADGLYALLKR